LLSSECLAKACEAFAERHMQVSRRESILLTEKFKYSEREIS
jgi:hypothetical protein